MKKETISVVETLPVSRQTKPERTGISRRGKVVIALLFALSAIGFTDKAIAGYVAVPIMGEFHLSSTQWGIVSGSFFWLFSLSSLLVGAWSDRVGTKWVLSLVAVVWTIVQVATVFVTSFPLLLLTRVGLGVGEGPSVGVAMTAAAKWLPRERRGLGFALMTCGNLVGLAVLTPILIVCASVYGWRSVFLILGGCSLCWLIGWTFVGKDGPQREGKMSRDGVCADGVGSREEGIDVGETGPRKGGPLWGIVRDVILMTLAMFAAYWMQALFLAWISVYLISVRHLPLNLIAVISALSVLLTCLVQISLSMLADRLFRRTGKLRAYVYVLCAVLVLTAAVNYGVVLVGPVTLSILLLCIQPNGAIFTLTGMLIANITPPGHRGTVQGASIAIGTFGGILGPTVTGPLLQAAGKNQAQGFQTVYLVSAVLLVVIALATLMFARPE